MLLPGVLLEYQNLGVHLIYYIHLCLLAIQEATRLFRHLPKPQATVCTC